MKSRQNWLLILLFCLQLPLSSIGQLITQGPIFGALTDTSVRIYLRAPTASIIKIRYSDSITMQPYAEQIVSVRNGLDNSIIAAIGHLEPDTRYHFRFLVNNRPDTIQASFKTFPKTGEKGTYTFVTGSCQETDNMKVFNVIPKHDPYFLLHTGDYTYPDYQISPDYAGDYKLVAHSYHKRYDEKIMKQMLQHIPIDYVFDDNDYVGGGGGRYYKNDFHCDGKPPFVRCHMDSFRFPDEWRRNVIAGYADFFPAYSMPDTSEGIFHSFQFGNAEFFFLDRNSAKPHPVSYAFKYNEKKRRWEFDPPADHCLFCEQQMEWLKEGLKNSTADWKFIVSGVPLNKNIALLIAAGIKLQRFQLADYNGFHMAAGFGSYWAAHPEEMLGFHQWLEDEAIKDVIVISGDTHHNLIDNGRNAGLPEINASGMSVSTTGLAWYLKWVGMASGNFRMKQEVWNKGGNGIRNRNFKNGFGKITIVEDQYVELSIIDEDNKTIAHHKVQHSTTSRRKSTKRRR